MASRLADIRQRGDSPVYINIEEEKGHEPDEEEAFLDQTQHEFEELSNLINHIITNTKAIIQLENRAHAETTQTQHKHIMSELDTLISSTMTNAKAVSNKIKIYRQKNQEYTEANPHSTLSQWRINKLNASTLRFQVKIFIFNYFIQLP